MPRASVRLVHDRLSLIAVIYIGLVAMVQQDMKKLVAYSSVAHMGFVTLGFFIFNDLGVAGGMVQMIATASCRAPCSCASACCTTACTRARSPATAAWSTPCPSSPPSPCCSRWPTAACRAPPASSASGWSSWARSRPTSGSARLAATALIFGAAYTLWMVKRVYFGGGQRRRADLTDINAREFLMLALLAVPCCTWASIPKPFTDVMHTSVAELLKHVASPS
jgi:NADH-quinone oxidoreductase subunit M